MPDEELIIDFRISLMSISYNKKGEMIGLSYRTNLPLSIPVKVAIAIIQEYVIEPRCERLYTKQGVTKRTGVLGSVTSDIGQNCYCFSVEGIPRTHCKSGSYNVDLSKFDFGGEDI